MKFREQLTRLGLPKDGENWNGILGRPRQVHSSPFETAVVVSPRTFTAAAVSAVTRPFPPGHLPPPLETKAAADSKG